MVNRFIYGDRLFDINNLILKLIDSLDSFSEFREYLEKLIEHKNEFEIEFNIIFIMLIDPNKIHLNCSLQSDCKLQHFLCNCNERSFDNFLDIESLREYFEDYNFIELQKKIINRLDEFLQILYFNKNQLDKILKPLQIFLENFYDDIKMILLCNSLDSLHLYDSIEFENYRIQSNENKMKELESNILELYKMLF
ncbi:hypothetical protein [Carp edema virus]|nr:hypothetical protein [Carp edema virus]